MSHMPISQINNDNVAPIYSNNQSLPMDTYSYNNCVLTHNIAYLSQLQVHQFFQIKADNDKLRTENAELKTNNDELQKEVTNVKKRLADCEAELKYERQRGCAHEVKKRYVVSRFKPYFVAPHQHSWTHEKVEQTISSICSLNDIIKLDRQWNFIKHNQTLQRLYYLIPALIKLNSMVGLDDIKKDIFKKVIYYIQNPHNEEYLHTIISGPPGVGKTEFARIYADIFVRLGVLKSDKFIEIKRDDLVGQYLGQTAPRTRKLLEEAMDGVLFLDEAYSLGNQEKRDSFSKEAIDMINQYLSEQKGKFMFIIAGYEEDLNSCLFAYNQGMRRRFHSHYNISGYKPDELRQIFLRKIQFANYHTGISNGELDRFFNENKEQFGYYGGDIEKLVNEIKQVQSLRTFSTNIRSKEVVIDDIIQSLNNIEEKKVNSQPPPFMYV
jgi:DNA polymerase III delta prime subunit